MRTTLGDHSYFACISDPDNVEDADIEGIPSSTSSQDDSGSSSSTSSAAAKPTKDPKDMTVDAEGVRDEELPEGAITLKSLFMLGSGGCLRRIERCYISF